MMRSKSILINMILSSILISQSNYKTYLGDGLTNLFSIPSNRTIIISGIIATGFASNYDRSIQSDVENNALMSKELAITGDYWGLAGQFLLWGAFSFSDNKDEKFQYASAAFLGNGMITYGIKYIVGRERPDRSNKRSFPSGHTSNSFLTASVAQEIYGSKVGIPAYLMATLSGLSRIQDNKHYLSDVIFGATLGIAVGKGFGHVYRQNRKLVQFRVIPFQQTISISMPLG